MHQTCLNVYITTNLISQQEQGQEQEHTQAPALVTLTPPIIPNNITYPAPGAVFIVYKSNDLESGSVIEVGPKNGPVIGFNLSDGNHFHWVEDIGTY